MKKNSTMRVAALLMTLTLVTTCFVGATFAKYVTSTSGEDKARVAYWGFDQAAKTTIDMFDDSYTNVASSNDDNVVAPGTSKTTTFAFGYTPKGAEVNSLTAGAIAMPEVAYTFKVDASITGDYDALDANSNFVWTLQKGEGTVNKYQTVEALIAAVKALSGDASGSKDYTAGQLPDAFTSADEVYKIGWDWTFYADDAGDEADTAMGNAQDLDDVTFTITISATQIN
ncbi:MAG: hypothetical protein E7334_11315 [Clostridiales bacterium]|nr:hypothetical protein [Clostridiales bacterium]